MSTRAADVMGPPSSLGLLDHALRWLLLVELAHSDRSVEELVERVGQPQALVSYHLSRLRSGGLVSSRRSARDGRVVYYRAELAACAASLAAVGPALHPGLELSPTSTPRLTVPRGGRPVRVLFVCTGNSARSQIAEALLGRLAGDAVVIRSAGSDPKPVHPLAVEVLARRGIDISSCRSTSLRELADERFDWVVTLCDKVREHCPDFGAGDHRVHWSVEDPSAVAGPGADERFEQVTAELDERLRWFTWSIAAQISNRTPITTPITIHEESDP